MKIPLVDLRAQTSALSSELQSAIRSVLQQAEFIGGDYVAEFEKRFANYIGRRFCIGCGNGTDAIEIALKALDIGQGDEVLVPAHTWISTAEAVNNVGAEPIFVDTDPDFYFIDIEDARRKITPHTRAIIPVHLYGHPADMDAVLSIARDYQLFVIEDCAQAHGAVYQGRKVGTFGDIATFSFYPGKNLGAFGDAGAVLTDSEELAQKCKMLRNHGQLTRHDHQILGRNSRLDALQAAVLLVKLAYLDRWNQQRRKHAEAYVSLLQDLQIQLPKEQPDCKHVYHLFVIQTSYRDELREFLQKKGIATAVHYPNALPFVPAYAYKGLSARDFPSVTSYLPKILSLPMYPELSNEAIEYIALQIRTFLQIRVC